MIHKYRRRKQFALVLRAPCPQSGYRVGSKDCTVRHHNQQWRIWGLFGHHNLADGALPLRPIVSQAILLLPVCFGSVLDQVAIIQPLRQS